jgi:Ca2+-binding EF-hand superfamily protein
MNQAELETLMAQITEMLQLCVPKFENFDEGIYPTRQLRNILRSINIVMSEEEVRDLELLLDPHSIGSLGRAWLVGALANLLGAYDPARTAEALEAMDTDADGRIPLEEFEAMISGDDPAFG